MLKIDILEDDLTRVSSAIGTDIPYIPGFAIQGEKVPSKPTLCKTIIEFEGYFGEAPVEFTDENGSFPNKFDASYVMAKELLALGMPVYYHAIFRTTDEVIAADHDLASKLVDIFNNKDNYITDPLDTMAYLRDRGEYTLKYITSGGYANFANGLYSKMIELAADRGDAIALIEDVHNPETLDPTNENSFYKKLLDNTDLDTYGSYGAAFIGWGEYILRKPFTLGKETTTKIKSAKLPACFGYLAAVAANLKVSPNWLAMAGTTRGLIPNLSNLITPINNPLANAYQPTKADDLTGTRALNAITEIKPYGLCIWGNRTLKRITEEDILTGTAFLNTRNMISDIKKVAYRVAKTLIYDQKNELLWLNFKSQVSPYLEQLKSGSGISDYKLLKLDTKYDGSALAKEEFACAIKIFPVYAVESFEITIVISDADVAVE